MRTFLQKTPDIYGSTGPKLSTKPAIPRKLSLLVKSFVTDFLRRDQFSCRQMLFVVGNMVALLLTLVHGVDTGFTNIPINTAHS